MVGQDSLVLSLFWLLLARVFLDAVCYIFCATATDGKQGSDLLWPFLCIGIETSWYSVPLVLLLTTISSWRAWHIFFFFLPLCVQMYLKRGSRPLEHFFWLSMWLVDVFLFVIPPHCNAKKAVWVPNKERKKERNTYQGVYFSIMSAFQSGSYVLRAIVF